MKQEQPSNRRREDFLTVFFAVVLGGALLLFLYLFTSAILAAVLAMVFVGYLHYAVWGFALSQETAGEREEELIRQRMEAEELESRRRGQ